MVKDNIGINTGGSRRSNRRGPTSASVKEGAEQTSEVGRSGGKPPVNIFLIMQNAAVLAILSFCSGLWRPCPPPPPLVPPVGNSTCKCLNSDADEASNTYCICKCLIDRKQTQKWREVKVIIENWSSCPVHTSVMKPQVVSNLGLCDWQVSALQLS